MSFWQTLPTPAFVLAPMADVTDASFRRLFAKYGTPDVTWTEFVSCDGLWHTREKQGIPDAENPLMRDLLYTEAERPIVAQLFSSKPEMMEYGARLCRELGFDGVDINMGCPDRSIVRQGCGAGMIRTPELAVAVIEAATRGAGSEEDGIPVSVKTRIGDTKNEIDTWVPTLLDSGIAALTMHARTRKELSLVPARWEHVAECVAIRDRMGVDTKILGNGDVTSLAEGRELAEETGADGVMVGRGIFGNPWFFAGDGVKESLAREEILRTLVHHCELFGELLPHKSFSIMKKHFKAYVHGWDGAKELRNALMECTNASEVRENIDKILKKTHTLT
ncbi:tRNA-dihydrouridine synthase [Patescibacteria group bacterium]|jgi:nifR3 family TIM-barrel protein|nr:tRNA-dihydrouridine synthase [Patescibacteria group bacterium]